MPESECAVAACVFCDIVSGRAPAHVVRQDIATTAFLDHRPITPGHTLVVPNSHIASLAELEDAAAAAMFRTALEVSAAIRASDGIVCEGVNLLLADGATAGQEVFHLHLHVVPRFAGDGFGFTLPHGHTRKPDADEQERIAAVLRAATLRSPRRPS